MSWLLRRTRWAISTSLIKRDIENKLRNPSSGGAVAYPRTFEEKVVLLNDPRTIQKLEIVEYGVKFKPGKKYLSLLLALSGLFFYINERQLPEKVIDHYFAISNTSDLQHPTGFLFSAFMFETPFYFYLPLLAVVNQLSKFVSNRWVLGLMAVNAVGCGLLGKKLVDERVEEYEVWDQERICYGEGTFIALGNCLWGALGLQGGFTALKSRLFLKSVPGLGITRAGLPLGYLCLFYLMLEAYLRVREGKKNSELVTFCAISGFITGLLIRRFAPLK